MKTFDIVVAADQRLGIGKDGKLPWNLPGDMAFFRRVTSEVQQPGKRNAVIMGRKTWESIPLKFRPLPKRLNIVLTRRDDLELPEGVLVARSLDDALSLVSGDESVEKTFLIGGGEVFAQGLKHPACRTLYLTQIDHDFDCDVFLPDYQRDFVPAENENKQTNHENGVSYRFSKFVHMLVLLILALAGLNADAADMKKADAKRGALVFQQMLCSQCHPGGENFIDPRKPIKGEAFLKRYPTDEQMAMRIREGSNNGGMPAFRKDRLSDQQLVDVIAYVRSLTVVQPAQKNVVSTKTSGPCGRTGRSAPTSEPCGRIGRSAPTSEPCGRIGRSARTKSSKQKSSG